MSSPYVFALNSPLIYKDNDGELPILINGFVNREYERGSARYWDRQIIETIKNSGLPNPGGDIFYVDGDRTIGFDGEQNIIQKEGAFGARGRNLAGYMAGLQDFDVILSKLERDPDSKKSLKRYRFIHIAEELHLVRVMLKHYYKRYKNLKINLKILIMQSNMF